VDELQSHPHLLQHGRSNLKARVGAAGTGDLRAEQAHDAAMAHDFDGDTTIFYEPPPDAYRPSPGTSEALVEAIAARLVAGPGNDGPGDSGAFVPPHVVVDDSAEVYEEGLNEEVVNEADDINGDMDGDDIAVEDQNDGDGEVDDGDNGPLGMDLDLELALHQLVEITNVPVEFARELLLAHQGDLAGAVSAVLDE
jgi:UBA-like domain